MTGLVSFALANSGFGAPQIVGANGIARWDGIPGMTRGAKGQ
ncbi:MAG: hypothetical protein ACK46I_01330 [Phycisphaerae bacterium]